MTPKITPSETTCKLIDLLIQRDALGQAKYGTSLDRTDFSILQWLDHQTEELLDGAGYAQAGKREILKLLEEVRQLRFVAQEFGMFRHAMNQLLRDMQRPRVYQPDVAQGISKAARMFDQALLEYDASAVLRQLGHK